VTHRTRPTLRVADRAVEDSCEALFAFVAFRDRFDHTAQAARRLSFAPLGGLPR